MNDTTQPPSKPSLQFGILDLLIVTTAAAAAAFCVGQMSGKAVAFAYLGGAIVFGLLVAIPLHSASRAMGRGNLLGKRLILRTLAALGGGIFGLPIALVLNVFAIKLFGTDFEWGNVSRVGIGAGLILGSISARLGIALGRVGFAILEFISIA